MNIKILDKNGVTLKTKGKYCTEDISVAVDESILGGNIEVPSVTNLVCSEDYILSWTAPDISSLAEYNPTISYVVNVNGVEVETSETTMNVLSLLVDGENSITVITKVTIKNNNSTNTTIMYSAPSDPILIKLTATLPIACGAIGLALVGDYIYLVGSYDNKDKSIRKFDTISETITTLNVSVAYGSGVENSVFVKDNIIYIIDNGYIYKFDTITETLSNTNLSLYAKYLPCGKVNDTVYVISNTDVKSYSTTDNSINTIISDLSLNIVFAGVGVVGENIYIFGGRNSVNGSTVTNNIHKFDSVSETITTLSVVLPTKLNQMGIAVIENDIYIIGGITSDRVNSSTQKIYKFNTINESIELLDLSLPTALHRCMAISKGKNIYVFGGATSTIHVYTSDILKIG